MNAKEENPLKDLLAAVGIDLERVPGVGFIVVLVDTSTGETGFSTNMERDAFLSSLGHVAKRVKGHAGGPAA